MPIINEGKRRVLIMGGNDIGVIGTTLTEGPQDELNGLAFFERDPDRDAGEKYGPDDVADMPLHIVFTDPQAVENLMAYLDRVRLSMLQSRCKHQPGYTKCRRCGKKLL